VAGGWNITIEGAKFKGVGDVLKAINLPKLAEEELRNALADMVNEAKGGKSVDGKAWPKYSESYEKAIHAGRIRGKANGDTTPNLRATGELWNSMQSKATNSGAELFPQGQHAPSRGVKRKVTKKGSIRYAKQKPRAKTKRTAAATRGASNAEIVSGLEKKRPFFGLGKKQLDRLETRISKELDKLLADLFKK
jgi:hypothetical protein